MIRRLAVRLGLLREIHYKYLGMTRSEVTGLGASLAAVAILVAALAVTFVPAYLLSQESCVNAAEVLDLDHQFDFLAGCFFDVDGHWIPSDAIRENDVLRGGS